jgi:hypothetical protein
MFIAKKYTCTKYLDMKKTTLKATFKVVEDLHGGDGELANIIYLSSLNAFSCAVCPL